MARRLLIPRFYSASRSRQKGNIPVRAIFGPTAAVLLFGGCMDALEEQTKKSPKSIIGKKTQDIGEFDPQAKRQEVSDSKVRVTDPISAPLQAYGPMVESISKSHVKHALDFFHAEHQRFPKDHAEFMEKVVRPNNIQLPVLPGGSKYQYDVDKHELVVVRATPPAEETEED